MNLYGFLIFAMLGGAIGIALAALLPVHVHWWSVDGFYRSCRCGALQERKPVGFADWEWVDRDL